MDVRLNNRSQLAGFAKRDDLKYFARTLCGMDYEHWPDLAPTREMFEQYKLNNGCWDTYAADFINLITQRQIEHLIKKQFSDACLLCSEHKPHHCHRRLVAEYLAGNGLMSVSSIYSNARTYVSVFFSLFGVV